MGISAQIFGAFVALAGVAIAQVVQFHIQIGYGRKKEKTTARLQAVCPHAAINDDKVETMFKMIDHQEMVYCMRCGTRIPKDAVEPVWNYEFRRKHNEDIKSVQAAIAEADALFARYTKKYGRLAIGPGVISDN